jgi:hypothetical protein
MKKYLERFTETVSFNLPLNTDAVISNSELGNWELGTGNCWELRTLET